MNNNQIVKNIKPGIIQDYYKEPHSLIEELARSITLFLSGEIDFKSFDKYKRSFELDCKKALHSIFISLFEKQSTLLIFPDVIPGFTTVIYKKSSSYFVQEAQKEIKNTLSSKRNKKIVKDSNATTENPLNFIFNSFFEKNNQTVLSIESDELIMMLCPVNDLDKYFKELELYI